MFVIFLIYVADFWIFFQPLHVFILFVFSLSLKSAFFTKLAISALVDKFACFNLPVTFCAVNVLNSRVVIYLLWLDFLLSTVVGAPLGAKLVILGICL